MEYHRKITVEKHIFFADGILENDKVVTKFVIAASLTTKGFVTKL